MNIGKIFLLMAVLLSFQSESFANEDKFCNSLNNCTRGSIIRVSGFDAQKYCDFRQAIVPVKQFFLSQDDQSQGAGYILQCVYRGSERTLELDVKNNSADLQR